MVGRTMWKRLQQRMAGNAGEAVSSGPLHRVRSRTQRISAWWQALAGKGTFVLVIMAFFLGRAMILGELAPFSIAFYAVVLRLKRSADKPVLAALILGTLTVNGVWSIWPMLVGALIFYRVVYG